MVLEEDLPNKGVKGDLIRVKRGYAREFLIPKGKAVYAVTRMPSYEFSIKSTMNVKKKPYVPATPREIAAYLKDKTLKIKTEHWAVLECHIAKALYFQSLLYVPLDCIDMPAPITKPGITPVTINIDGLNESVDVAFDIEFQERYSKVNDDALDSLEARQEAA